MRTRKEIRRVTSTIKLTVWSARYIGNPRRLLRVCGDRVRKGWWCTLVARPLFELDSETKPTGRPCRPPSLRHRPRRVGSARLAQEAEGRCHRNRLIKQTRLGEAPHACNGLHR